MFRSLLLILLLSLLPACTEREPVVIGFIGGLSGKNADLGVAGRNGALLAVEEANGEGGISGRAVTLVDVDDMQDPEIARRRVDELLARKPAAIVGPMTSMVAKAILPRVERAGTILVSPTVTTRELTGKDDLFIRVCSPTTEYATVNARAQRRLLRGETAAVLYDRGNESYTLSWLEDYRRAFETQGGRVIATIPFTSSPDTDHEALARSILAARPAIAVIVANAVDGGLITQHLRRIDPSQQIAIPEWSATERFVELAGKSAEGVIGTQFFRRDDSSPPYLRFVERYRSRFRQEPGFAGVTGYDAARVVIDALRRRTGTEPLKGLIVGRTHQGVQQPIEIDRFGDARRKNFPFVVRDGRFMTME